MPGMEILGWLGTHWFELLQMTSILVGLFATVYTLRDDVKERRVENLLALTAAHREIWSRLYEKPELRRILHDDVDLEASPPSSDEQLFVHLLILHLNAALKARNSGMDFSDDALATDIRHFFAHPITQHVWQRSKLYQNPDFVAFVEAHMVG